MIFKVSALREEIGDSLDMYSFNSGNSSTYPLFRKGIKKITLLLCVGAVGLDCELDIESCEVVGGQFMS